MVREFDYAKCPQCGRHDSTCWSELWSSTEDVEDLFYECGNCNKWFKVETLYKPVKILSKEMMTKEEVEQYQKDILGD